jgi:hypothetical protein
MSNLPTPTYNDLAQLYQKEQSNAMIFTRVPKDYDVLNFDEKQPSEEENKAQLNKVVFRTPNTRLWTGVAVAATMALVPASIVSPTAVALTQGIMMVGLGVMLAARNSMGNMVNAVEQQYIVAHASIKEKVRNTQLQEKYTAIKAKRDRRMTTGTGLIAASLVTSIASNTDTTAGSLFMTAGLCVLSLALTNHARLKWTAGKSMDMAQTIAKRRGELVEQSPPEPTKAPSV